MARATWILGSTTIIGFVMSAYLAWHRDRTCTTTTDAAQQVATPPPSSSATIAQRMPCADLVRPRTHTPASAGAVESALDSRAQMTAWMEALLGRQSGESDDEYRARLAAMLQDMLADPRARAREMRRTAEEKAGVTKEQSTALDAAFTKVYANMLALTNKAIVDGKLSPYERNAAAWLEFAGDVGHELEAANGTIETILQPDQLRAMYDAGFDWAEYLGTQTPWENFAALPSKASK